MAAFDEEPVRKPAKHEVGQDLSALSVHELEERILMLEAEIERLAAAKAKKTDSKTAAESFFKS